MAEFKLGRIRFVWKGDWAGSTVYYTDDVIRYGGKTYICVVGHTSADDFYTDLDFNPTKWNQMTDGTSWRGNWATETFYKLNDIVKYGGLLYICTTQHTSAVNTSLGLEDDQASWEVYAEGIDWKGAWGISTRYKINDVVKYGGITYICTVGHTSADNLTDGLEVNVNNWDIWNPGIEYKGAWLTGTRYKNNDVVRYGANLYIALDDHTASDFATDFAALNWDFFSKGFEFESTWNSGTTYQVGDVVTYGGNQYVSKTTNSDQEPPISTASWDLFNEGFKFQNDWSISTSYKISEVVRLNGYSYLATADTTSVSETATASSNADNSISIGDTSDLEAGMAIVFGGTSFGDINPGATYYVKQVIDGVKFTITDTPSGTVITPTTDTGSMTITAAPKPPNSSYWTRLSSGLSWQGEWTDDAEYVVGDLVRFNSSVYICMQAHRSEGDDGSTIRAEGGGLDNSRPDQDTTATYWNLFSVGTETGVLTTRGDLVYFGANGPQRLPIGIEGQVLVAGSSDPEWRSLNTVDKVYYVAKHGQDLPSPVHGKSWDQPFKTVRYATEQVEKGPKVPNASYLLEMNRVFIQKETTEWIEWQIANADPGSIWESFDYDEYKCERDIGFIVDAFINDLRRGGNEKSRDAALSYVNDAGQFYVLGQEEQTVAAISYAITIIENVLDQTAPDVNYQVLNGDNSTAVVAQFFDNTITAETDYETDGGATGYLGGVTGVSGSAGDSGPVYGGY